MPTYWLRQSRKVSNPSVSVQYKWEAREPEVMSDISFRLHTTWNSSSWSHWSRHTVFVTQDGKQLYVLWAILRRKENQDDLSQKRPSTSMWDQKADHCSWAICSMIKIIISSSVEQKCLWLPFRKIRFLNSLTKHWSISTHQGCLIYQLLCLPSDIDWFIQLKVYCFLLLTNAAATVAIVPKEAFYHPHMTTYEDNNEIAIYLWQ